MSDEQPWTLAQAKAKFSEVVDRALTIGPQVITRRGRSAAVVVSAEEWDRKCGRLGRLVDFLETSPLRDSGIESERRRDQPAKIDL